MRMSMREKLDRVYLILKNLGKVHYTHLAVMLGISVSHANQLARATANFYPQVVYERGYLVLAGNSETTSSEVERVLSARPVDE